MKYHSYLWSISYDVIILVRYDQGKGSDCVILKFFYFGDWGLKRVKYPGLVTKYISKVLLGFPSSRLSELSSSFKLMVIFVPLTNLLVLCISLWESSICDFSSIHISEFSSLSVCIPLFNTIFLPVTDNTSIDLCNKI